jgi:RNase P/RNase MRP subunit POP5
MPKKKINVIRPTLRHKKRYVTLKFIGSTIIQDKQKIFTLLYKSLQKTNGIFVQISTNITVLDFDSETNIALIRINKDYLSEFLGSLFFLDSDFGEVKVISIDSTIKQVNK